MSQLIVCICFIQDTLPALGSRTYFVRPPAVNYKKFPKKLNAFQKRVYLTGEDLQIGSSDDVSLALILL